MSGGFMLDLWDDGAEYLILDDFQDWSKFYLFKQFFGGQEEFVVTDKYRKKRNVKWGKPVIVLSNCRPQWFWEEDGNWMRANVIECEVKNKLYLQ